MNNVNTTEMKKFVETIAKDPQQAQKNKKATGSWVFEEGRPQFVGTIEYVKGKLALNAELPPFAGGWGTSPDPIQYCLYGLGACFAVTFEAAAAGEGVQLKKLQVTAENWMDLRRQMGISREPIIKKVRFTVQAEGAPREVLQRLLKLAEERCPGSECVTRSIPLEVELQP